MVSPVIRERETEVNAYFPADIWYNYHTGEIEHENETIGQSKLLHTDINEIQLHVRSGYIIPTQNPANTTEYSRQNPFGLIIHMLFQILCKSMRFCLQFDSSPVFA